MIIYKKGSRRNAAPPHTDICFYRSAGVELGYRLVCLDQHRALAELLYEPVSSLVDPVYVRVAEIDDNGILLIQLSVVYPASACRLDGVAPK